MEVETGGYARRLSLADLRAAVEFQNSPAGKSYRSAIPVVVVDTMQLIGKMDYMLAAYCRETGKLRVK